MESLAAEHKERNRPERVGAIGRYPCLGFEMLTKPQSSWTIYLANNMLSKLPCGNICSRRDTCCRSYTSCLSDHDINLADVQGTELASSAQYLIDLRLR